MFKSQSNNIIYKNLLYHKYKLLLIVFLLFLTTSLHMCTPMIYRSIVEELTIGKNYDKIVYYAFLYFFIIIFMDIFESIKNYYYKKSSALIGFGIRKDFIKHLFRFPLSYFENNRSGELYTVTTSDIAKIEGFITTTSITIISSFLQVTITLCFLFYLNVKLTLICLSFIPVTQFLLNLSNKKIEKSSKRERNELSKVNSYIQEIFQGIYTIKVYNLVNRMILKTIKPTRLFIKNRLQTDVFYSISANLANISNSFSIILLFYIIGGKDVIENKLTLGELLAFSMYMGWVVRPMINLFKLLPLYKRVKISYNKVIEIMNNKPKLEGDKKFKNQSINNIYLDKITFYYDKINSVLKDLSLSINKGESIALVGPTGCGKSSIVKLLLRNCIPQKGNIFINNTNIEELDNKYLRSSIGVVLQDSFFFNDTILNNLKLVSPSSSDEEIANICKLIKIHEFIMKLPEKYNTEIGDKGVRLSGGQKQKLAIARLILYNPDIFIFDEATSHLDNNSEHEIMKNINNYLKGNTKIFIAHRLSTIKNVNKICVIDNGNIVEQGDHNKLIAKKGLYYELWAKTTKENNK